MKPRGRGERGEVNDCRGRREGLEERELEGMRRRERKECGLGRLVEGRTRRGREGGT